MPWIRSRVFVGIGFLGAVCSALACSAGSGGGGASPAGDNPAGLSLTGETFPIDFNGEAVFDIGASGPAESAGFAVMLFTGSPIDSPTDGELLIEAAGLRVIPRAGGPAATTGSITVSARIADCGSTSPCTSGEDIGSFAVAYDEAGVSVSTTALPLPSASLEHAATGQFTLCLMCSGDFDATLEIDRLLVRFGSAAESSPPEPDEEIEVTFPDTGDAVMIVEDASAGASITYFGTADPDTGEARFTGFEMESAEGTLSVSLDEEGRPTELATESMLITAAYNDDGTVGYELVADGDVSLSGSGTPLADAEMEELALAMEAAASDVTARQLHNQSLEKVSPYCKTFNMNLCKRIVLAQFVVGAILDRGYKNYVKKRVDLVPLLAAAHGILELPIYECVSKDESAQELAGNICSGVYMEGTMREADVTLREGDPEPMYDFIDGLGKVSAAMGFMMLFGDGIAGDYWDKPGCGCKPDDKCGSGFVCNDGECGPSCGGPEDCPEGRKVCLPDGHCVAETPEEEPPSDDEDETPETPETPDTGDFECPVPEGAERMQSVGADGRSSEFYWLDDVGYVGPYLLWWDAAMTRQREQSCYDSEAKRHGWSRHWFENGKLRLEAEYQHGQRHGVYREWHPGGEHKKTEARYVNNKLEGLERIWYSNGERHYEIEYTAGVKNGAFREFWDNGKPKFETNFVNGVEHGTQRHFDETGTLTITCDVENDVIISCSEP